jgi:hypothetical protein
MVPSGVTKDQLTDGEYAEHIKAIVKSDARVLFLAVQSQSAFAVIEALYKAGLRVGDVVVVAVEWLSDAGIA